MILKRIFSLVTAVLIFTLTTGAQSRGSMTRGEYIDTYKEMAISEMLRSGVPASITLAQGMLESDNGNSTLATKANNHFGIKCHSDWTGPKVYHDDDKRKECFRKYKSANESFLDHSDFLMSGSRYSFLFELDMTDYKAWAKGLKKAGYATSNTYADKLIQIIEDNELHKYDLQGSAEYKSVKGRNKRDHESNEVSPGRDVLIRNRVKFVVVKPEDTFRSLQEEFDLLPFEIYKYNDMARDEELSTGQEIYLQPKRSKAEVGNSWHTVREGETMQQISQMYAVKTEKLYKLNLMMPGQEIKAGDKISLRKRVSGSKPKPGLKSKQELKPEPEPTSVSRPKHEKDRVPDKVEDSEGELRFEFDE